MSEKTYATSAALNSAVIDSIRKTNSASASHASLRSWVFDRFLSRIFDDSQGRSWALKGGTAMLARIADARSTTDIDLLHKDEDEAAAIGKLVAAANLDLGDFLFFEFYDSRPILENENVPYLKGVRVRFVVRFGVKNLEHLTIDLSLTDELPSRIIEQVPANRLEITGLKTSRYYLYPIENHIADKICAILQSYSTGFSSRTKDLIDLVIIANKFTVASETLEEALDMEFSLRRIDRPTTYVADKNWKSTYENMATALEPLEKHKKLLQAEALVNEFLFNIPKNCGAKSWDNKFSRWV